jgi:hypothetical protein
MPGPSPQRRARRPLDRALPGPLVDLIRDGVGGRDLRFEGDRAVWSALVRTAASAAQRGWDAWEWEELVLQPDSRLGVQAQIRRSRRLPEARVHQTLDAAWDRATAWANEQPPPFDGQEMADEVERKAVLAELRLQDPDNGLLDADRRVLLYAVAEARQRGLDRLALPWRSIKDATGLGERTVKKSLRRLDAGGHLILEKPGRPGPSSRRASLYRLPG